jgi:alpha-L-arabinofuranosidase
MKKTIIRSAAALTTALLTLSGAAAVPAPADTSIVVHADKPGAVINKNVYGQFTEHLGHGIYEGIYVGKDSPIPNTNGFRKDVVAALKSLHVPLVRWPGGCFADQYHWREGVGPQSQRVVRINNNWGGVPENNAFGTHEFFELIDMIGADAYVNANVGTGTVQEMADWMEYMTGDQDTTLVKMRKINGRDKPWKIAMLAMGNELWGCGGNMRPDYYADLYKQYASFVHAKPGERPLLIASGDSDKDTVWISTLLKEVKPGMMDAISMHYYTLPTGDWQHKGAAIGFPESEWISTFANTLQLDGFIKTKVALLNAADPKNKVGLYVDEWGTWYDPAPNSNPGFLVQQNSLRDALVASTNFNIFHKYADRVRMTAIAQTVNVLQAMILTDGAKMIKTPTYYAYQMYIPFQDATMLPVDLKTANYTLGKVSVPQVNVSAAKTKAGGIVVGLTNLDPNQPASVSIAIAGAKPGAVGGTVLTASAMDAQNTFDAPDAVHPVPFSGATVADGKLSVTLPPKSVVVLDVK